MIDPSVRLRRALQLEDLILVKRIISGHPDMIRNPNYDDKNNSSLHTAAVLGNVELVQYLISSGHENPGISKNTDGNTSLMVAIDSGQESTAALLAREFPRCIPWKNHTGLDALMLATKHGLSSTVSLLLNIHPNPQELLSATDSDGNTPLHFASANGQLLCLRILLTAGADPMVENNFRCTPAMGSRSKEASTYFLSLVRDIELRKRSERDKEEEVQRQRLGGVRVVSNTEDAGIGQAVSGNIDDEESSEDNGAELEHPPSRAVFGSVDSGRQSPATRIRRWEAFSGQSRSRAGSYEAREQGR